MKLLTYLNFIMQALFMILENQKIIASALYNMAKETDEHKRIEELSEYGLVVSNRTGKFLKDYQKTFEKEARE